MRESLLSPSRWVAMARAAMRRGVVDLSLSMGAVLALGFAQNLVLARVLAPEGMGHIGVINTVVNFANLLGTAGLTTSILRYGAAEREPAAAWAIYHASSRLVVLLSAGVMLAVALFSRSPLWIFDPTAALWIPLVVLSLTPRSIAACATEFCQARERMRAKAVLMLLAKVVLVASVVGGALLGGFVGAVTGMLVGGVVGSVLPLVYVRRLRPPARVASRIPYRELLRFGRWSVLTNFLGLVLVTADVLCLSALIQDAAVVGHYFIAVVFQQVVRVPMLAYLDARFPEMARTAQSVDELRRLRRRMRLHVIGLALAPALAVGALAPWVVPLFFGEAYQASVTPLQILLASHVLFACGAAQGRSMLAAGWVEGNFWTSLIAAVANIALNLALIPEFGAAGAALATALTRVVWALAVSVLCRWHERVRERQR